MHAAGKGYPDLVRLRAGEPEGAPDAVLYPAGHDQIRAVLEHCARASLAVVPFGGGTSVVGGVAPLRGEHGAVVALDMGRMGTVLDLDRESRTVTVQAGIRAPALERASGRARTDARPLPAVLRVRLAGRLRGHAISGAVLHGLWRDRADGARPALRRAGGGDRAAGRARHRGWTGPAPAAGRLGGNARGDQRARAAGPRRPARARLRRRVLRGLRRRSAGAASAFARARAARRRAPLRRAGDAHVARAGGRRFGQGPAGARVSGPARIPRGLLGDLRLRG